MDGHPCANDQEESGEIQELKELKELKEKEKIQGANDDT